MLSGVGVPLVVENTPIAKPQGVEVIEGVGVLLGVLEGVAVFVVLGVGVAVFVVLGVGVLVGVLVTEGVGVFEGVFDADKVIHKVSAACTAPPELTPKKYELRPLGPTPDHPK